MLVNELYVSLTCEMGRAATEGLPTEASPRDQLRHTWDRRVGWATDAPEKRRVPQPNRFTPKMHQSCELSPPWRRLTTNWTCFAATGKDQRRKQTVWLGSVNGCSFVGRRGELATLGVQLARALSGLPSVMFVEGPAGNGKTAPLDRFTASVGESGLVRVSSDEDEL